jgi:LuxR family transcriptional regulator, maltose regulon positive regulatory protein
MARSFRLEPPPIEEMLERPRLLAQLRRRFDVPIIAVVAGAGFGKSTLLGQALAENLIEPQGVDVWLSCDSGDAVASRFAGDLARAAGLDVDVNGPEVAARLANALASHSSAGLCIVLDDVHEVDPDSGGGAILRNLAVALPPTVHVVFGSRTAVPGLARRRAQGTVVDISEQDMRFTPAEAAIVAVASGGDAEAGRGVGGWPALVRLTAAFGPSEAASFAAEEVLGAVPEARRVALARLVIAGGGDPELCRAALGPDAPDAAVIVEGLPLITQDRERIVPHALWRDVVRGVLSPREQAQVRRRVADTLLARKEPWAAADLFHVAGDDEGLRAALRDACSQGYAGIQPDVVASWIGRLPPALVDTPEGCFLRGVSARSSDPFGEPTRDLLERAFREFQAAGDDHGILAAGSEYAFVCRARGEFDRLGDVMTAAFVLEARGFEPARGVSSLARGVIAQNLGDDEAAFTEFRRVPPATLSRDWRAMVEFLTAAVAFQLGRGEECLAAAQRCVELGGPHYLAPRWVLPIVRFLVGQPDDPSITIPRPGDDAQSTPIDRLWSGALVAVVDANAGRVDDARAALAVARDAVRGAALPQLLGLVASAEAAVAVAAGDEEDAASVLRTHLFQAPASTPLFERGLRWVLALAYVLLPELREQWDREEMGPLHRQMRSAAAAVVALRAGSDVTDAFGTEWPSPTMIANTIPLVWSAPLAAALVDAGCPEGRELAEILVDRSGELARSAFRAASDAPQKPVARGARTLLAGVAVAGAQPVEVGLLGPTQLRVAGKPMDDAAWRREKVRCLLAFLAHHGTTTRDRVVDALWPDLDLDAGRKNLRVNLTHLQRLLEPDRRAGEAPFYVRQDGATLRILGAPHLRMDTELFEAKLTEAGARRANGDLTDAFRALEGALALWRGDYLAEFVYEDWATIASETMRARYVRAGVDAAELALAVGDVGRAAQIAAGALTTDPYFEPAYRVLAATHLATGNRSAARQALDRCDEALAELGVPADPSTAMLRRRVGTTPAVEV